MELSLKYMKKFDYFIPCFYDFRKNREPEEHIEVRVGNIVVENQ